MGIEILTFYEFIKIRVEKSRYKMRAQRSQPETRIVQLTVHKQKRTARNL